MNRLLVFLSTVAIGLSLFLVWEISITKPIESKSIAIDNIKSIEEIPAVMGGSTDVITPASKPHISSENNLITKKFLNYLDPNIVARRNDNPEEYTLIATGDVMPARSVNVKSLVANNFRLPYEKTRDLLGSSDLVFINLETPLVKNCPPTIEGMIFCADERSVEGLVWAGINVVNIANNHIGNYGYEGTKNTLDILLSNRLYVTGTSQETIIKVRDKTFGFLGYNGIGAKSLGINWASPEKFIEDISTLKKRVDFVIVAFHWGVEYTSSPNQTQQKLAHLAIDAGADLIIGNHPHWTQGVEIYKNKFITYSHGNFIFDQMWSNETREGVVGKYTFDKTGPINVQFVPVIIDDYSTPRYANETEAKKILNRMKEGSPKTTF